MKMVEWKSRPIGKTIITKEFKQKTPVKVAMGKKSRKEGKDFEPRVYKDLTEKGWIVNRWSNDVKENQLVQAKTSWRRTPHGMFPMNLTPGMPDFVCHKFFKYGDLDGNNYQLIGVECKISGVLDRPEKDKCQWYLDNKIFSKILIASKHKIKNRINIEYKEFNGNNN